MPRDAIGLDIGGANLKAATASGDALSIPFELWRQPNRLADELAGIRDRWPDVPTVGVTMTGELCDCFPTKRDGVRHILAAVGTAFPRHDIRVWTTAGRFVRVEDADRTYLAVAAANWHALATFVGREMPAGPALLLDTGSTTTDIIPILDRAPVPLGTTDPDRLRSGELVYTGVRRTPVCAVIGPKVTAEWFATTHDVHVLLGHLPAEPENRSTADGRPMTATNAHARLARMLGGDSETTPTDETITLARQAFAAQRRAIVAGIRGVVERLPGRPRTVCVAGSGEFLARAAWEDCRGADGPDATSLSDRWGPGRAAAGCAVAVAYLAAEVEA
jgi:(4-(4-[2-(gamma-L-glutamylamino)ethyl]phenoxymethyl)furan-2-yl)methanamine synthase